MTIRKIVSRSIGTDVIAAEDLANNSVTVAEISDGAVTSAKLDTNIDIAGTLDVTGATTLDAGLTVDTDTLVVDETNNRVGIGESTPDSLIHAYAATDNQIAHFESGDEYVHVKFTDSTAAFGPYIGAQGNDFRIVTGDGGGSSEALRIDAYSRLLIGDSTTISSPDRKLQITGTTADNSSMSLARFSNSANASQITFIKSRAGGNGSNGVVSDDDTIGLLQFHADDGSDYDSVAAIILAESDGTSGSNDTPGRLSFRTTADGAGSATERMRIDSNNNVQIGTVGIAKHASNTDPTITVNGHQHTTFRSTSGSTRTLTFKGTSHYYIRLVYTSLGNNSNNGISTAMFIAGRRDVGGHTHNTADIVNTDSNISVATSDSGSTRTYTLTLTNAQGNNNGHYVEVWYSNITDLSYG